MLLLLVQSRRRRKGGQDFLYIVADEGFFLSWRRSYVRGESLPTALLLFLFFSMSQCLPARGPTACPVGPFPGNTALAEARQRQGWEVGWVGGGTLPASHMITDPDAPAPT